MKCDQCGEEKEQSDIFQTGVFTSATKADPAGKLVILNLCYDCRVKHEKHSDMVRKGVKP